MQKSTSRRTSKHRWQQRYQHIAMFLYYLTIATILLLATAPWWLAAIGYWLVLPPSPHPADAIAIFGGSHERTLHAIDLFKQSLAPELWQTGWNKPVPPGPSTSGLNEHWNPQVQQRSNEIPPAAVYLLASNSTWEDGREIATLARQRRHHSLLAITDWYHSRRALCVLHHHLAGSGITIYYAPTSPPPTSLATWWQDKHLRGIVLEELQKIAYYWLTYGVSPWDCPPPATPAP